jgi:hypothetical protein
MASSFDDALLLTPVDRLHDGKVFRCSSFYLNKCYDITLGGDDINLAKLGLIVAGHDGGTEPLKVCGNRGLTLEAK